jgi:hypothetical protein
MLLVALGLAAAALPLVVAADPWPALAIPPENARSLRAPPRRPPPGDVDARARLLVDALRSGEAADLQRAEGFFLPREPFLAIKDMSGARATSRPCCAGTAGTSAERAPRRDWSGARFEGFELSRACTWMTVGREANRLPYWSCYRSTLRVAVGGRTERVEVRVMIHWGDRWYARTSGRCPAALSRHNVPALDSAARGGANEPPAMSTHPHHESFEDVLAVLRAGAQATRNRAMHAVGTSVGDAVALAGLLTPRSGWSPRAACSATAPRGLALLHRREPPRHLRAPAVVLLPATS